MVVCSMLIWIRAIKVGLLLSVTLLLKIGRHVVLSLIFVASASIVCSIKLIWLMVWRRREVLVIICSMLILNVGRRKLCRIRRRRFSWWSR